MKLKALVVSLYMCASLVGCNQPAEKPKEADKTEATATQQNENTQAEETSQLPADAPSYQIGTISSFPPFVDRDEYGKPIGFDLDILKAIGEKEGFRTEVEVLPWQGLLEKLDSNKSDIDIVATGVVITPERQEKYSFSDPYLDTKWGGLMIAKDGEDKYTSLAKAATDGKKFVTQKGSAGVEAAKKINNAVTLLEVDSQFQELEKVAQGKADVAFDISRVLQYYANTEYMKQFNFYLVMDESSETQNFGYAVKQDNKEVLDKINSGLAKIKADGTYDKIYAKWFGAK